MATPIIDVSGIGPASATILAENGITSAEELAAQTVRQVASIKTFSEIRAARVIEAAKDLLAAEPAPAPVVEKDVPVKEAAPKKKTGKKAAPKADKKKPKEKGKEKKKDKPKEKKAKKEEKPVKKKKADKPKKKKKEDKLDKKVKKSAKDKKSKKSDKTKKKSVVSQR